MARKYTRKPKKGSRRPRYRKRGATVGQFNKAPMPNKFASKLRYVETNLDIDPGNLTTAGVYIFSANGLYDPNISIGGHQPRGFDQLMTMYDHYTVIGSRITVTFTQQLGQVYNTATLGIALKDSPTGYTDINDYLEGRNLISRTSGSSSATETQRPITLSYAYSTKKFLGISHPLSEKDTAGSNTSNPVEQAYFHLFVAPLSFTDSVSWRCTARIDYLVIFTEPKQPQQS